VSQEKGTIKNENRIISKRCQSNLKDGKVFTGLFYEIFWEEKEIMIGNTIIEMKDIAKMEEI